MGRIGGTQMALFGPLETLLSVIWSILFLHERLAPLQMVGGGLILGQRLAGRPTLWATADLHLPRR